MNRDSGPIVAEAGSGGGRASSRRDRSSSVARSRPGRMRPRVWNAGISPPHSRTRANKHPARPDPMGQRQAGEHVVQGVPAPPRPGVPAGGQARDADDVEVEDVEVILRPGRRS